MLSQVNFVPLSPLGREMFTLLTGGVEFEQITMFVVLISAAAKNGKQQKYYFKSNLNWYNKSNG